MIRNTHLLKFPDDANAGGSTATADAGADAGADAEPGAVVGVAGGGVDIKKSGVPKGAESFKDASSRYLKEQGLSRTPEPATAGESVGEEDEPSELPSDASAEERDAHEAARSAEAELAALETAEETAARKADEQAERERKAKKETPETPEDTASEETPEPEKKSETVVLKGLSDRNEKDITLEIDDPEIATRLRRLENDGMRRAAFDEAIKDVDSRSAELLAIEDALREDPVAFALSHMTAGRQLEVVRALMLEHFDALEQDIADLSADPTARHRLRADLKDRLHQSGDVLRASRERQTRANQIMAAVRALIPDTVSPDDTRYFLADAERDMIAEVQSGRPVTPENVAQILSRRVSQYGFSTATPAATTGNGASPGPGGNPGGRALPAATPTPQTVRPVGDRARELAAKREAVAQAKARVEQERIRRAQVARRTASRVAPPGAGAGAVSMPAVPATADIREASKAIRRALAPGGGWPKA